VDTGAGTSRIHEGSTIREATGETAGEEVVAIINMKGGVVEEEEAMTRGTMVSIAGGMRTTGVEGGMKVTEEGMTDAIAEVAEGQLSERRPWKVSKGLRDKLLLFLHQRPFPKPPPPPPDRKSLEKVAMCQGLKGLLKESGVEKEGEGGRQDHLGGEESELGHDRPLLGLETILQYFAIIRSNNTCSNK